MKIIKHVRSGQIKVLKDKEAKMFLKFNDWQEIDEKGKPIKKAKQKK